MLYKASIAALLVNGIAFTHGFLATPAPSRGGSPQMMAWDAPGRGTTYTDITKTIGNTPSAQATRSRAATAPMSMPRARPSSRPCGALAYLSPRPPCPPVCAMRQS